MDARTETLLLNTALKVALDATGLIPGLSQFKAALEIANDVAPAVEEAVAYFQSPEGRRAVAHMQTLFGAISKAAGDHITFATEQPKTPAYAGYHREWDMLQGWVWVRN